MTDGWTLNIDVARREVQIVCAFDFHYRQLEQDFHSRFGCTTPCAPPHRARTTRSASGASDVYRRFVPAVQLLKCGSGDEISPDAFMTGVFMICSNI